MELKKVHSIRANSSTIKRILITGANSYIGTSVEKWLMKEPNKYVVDTLDMKDDSWREKDFSNYDVVFHVAGIAHVKAKKSQKGLYYKINRDLAIETAEKAKNEGVTQFIFMSSIIVYGESKSLKPVIITKDTIPNPNGFYGDSKLQAEKGINKLQDKNFNVVILRPPMVYGPGSKGNFPKLIKLAKSTPLFPNYHNQRSMLYIGTLCEFVRLIIDSGTQGTFFPQNTEYVSTNNVVRMVAKFCDRRIFVSNLLNPLVFLGSFFIPSINKMWGTLIYEESLNTLSKYLVNPKSFEESLLEYFADRKK